MTDHESTRQLFATSLDFPLEPAERDALDAHLRDCPACRSFTAAMRSDASVLRDLDFGPVPVAVRANIAIAAGRRDRGGAVGRWIAIVGVGALLIVALGGGALGVGGGRGGSGDPGQSSIPAANDQIAWQTEVVKLTAREFSIVAGGKTFRAATPKVDVQSDPGDASYRTLEATWQELGVEMRLFLYFGGDATAWWVDEVRIYNGAIDAQWLYAKGTFFKTPLGAVWTGDQDIAMTDNDGVGGTPAVVHLAGATLASRPFDGITEPLGGGIILPENSRPFGPGGILHCSGILQMAPRDAEKVLLALGYRLSWRLTTATGPNTDDSEVVARAPDGVIALTDEPPVGSSGELILFVAPFGDQRAKALPYPEDCPDPGRSVSPASPVP